MATSLRNIQDTAVHLKDQVTDTVSDVGRNLRDRINDAREPAARQLRNAAGAVTNFASNASETMQATAGYIREHDAKEMVSDFRSFVRKHPTQSLIAAMAAGFLIGQAMRNHD